MYVVCEERLKEFECLSVKGRLNGVVKTASNYVNVVEKKKDITVDWIKQNRVKHQQRRLIFEKKNIVTVILQSMFFREIEIVYQRVLQKPN